MTTVDGKTDKLGWDQGHCNAWWGQGCALLTCADSALNSPGPKLSLTPPAIGPGKPGLP